MRPLHLHQVLDREFLSKLASWNGGTFLHLTGTY